MLIDLREIRTHIIASAEDDPDRYKSVTAMAERLGLNYEVHRPVYVRANGIGCAIAHLHILASAQAPCLVLEDDCETTSHLQIRFEVPDEADAVHLGVCTVGIPLSDHPRRRVTFPVSDQPGEPKRKDRRVPRCILGAAVTTEYNEIFLRAHNMVSTHAYLYLGKEMIETVRGEILESLTIPWHWDVAMARLQKSRLVLTPRRPFFYQKDTKDVTLPETDLEPVPNPDELDDAWFERRLDTERSGHKLYYRILIYSLHRFRLGLGWLMGKLP